MSDDFYVRRYEPSDHDRVLELHEHALRDADGYVEDVPPEAEADLHDITGTYLGDGEFLVGETDGKIVAMGGFRTMEGRSVGFERTIAEPERTAECKRMRVAPACQRRGFGERILHVLEDTARERGFERMVLDTGPEMTAARSFYEKHGYEETGQQTFRDGEFAVVFYEKDL